MNICEICRKDSPEDGKLQKVYAKGYASLTKQCQLIGKTSLLELLRTNGIAIAQLQCTKDADHFSC